MERTLTLMMILGASHVAWAGDPPGDASAAAAQIDGILTRLEKRSDGLTDIRCSVRLVEDDQMNLSKQTKHGRILFMITEPNPHFMIHFDKTEVDGILGKKEWYLFDGRWLYQALERLQQVTKQEIAAPGEKIDMFNLERTPFPVPFGQKKETMLRHFDIKLMPPSGGDPPGTDHLVCVPKTDSEMRRRYDRVEFFVLKDVHLPARIVVTRNEGLEVTTADFPDLSAKSINAGVTAGDFERPSAWKKYKEIVEEAAPVERGAP